MNQAIIDSVEAVRPDLIDFLQQLVQTPSLPDEEYAVQEKIAQKLKEIGLDVEMVPTRFEELHHHPAFGDDGFSPDSRINVIGEWPATSGQNQSAHAGQGSLILNGHVDVVSPGDECLWGQSPWSGQIVDGKMYGRGSCDMKSGLTAAIFAIVALKRLDYQPTHHILLESVIGEESGGVGTLTTIVNGYSADAAIILEPTCMEVCPVQAGALTFRLTVSGKAAHAAMKSDGVSAIDKFMLVNNAINELDFQRHRSYHNPLYDNSNCIAPINIGTIQGGVWHSTVPEEIVAEGRCGVFPGESPEVVRQMLAEAIQKAAQQDEWLGKNPPRLEWFEGQFESGETNVNHPIIQTLIKKHRVINQSLPPIKGVSYGSDLRLFTNHAQIPAVLYGPGDVRLAHAVDEYVPLDEVVAVAKTIALTIYEWCGGKLENNLA